MPRRWSSAGFGAVALVMGCGSQVPPLERAPVPVAAAMDAAVDAPPPPPPDAALTGGPVDDAQRALGERYVAATGLRIASRQRPHIGNTEQVFAPVVAMADGGIVLVGTRVTPRAGRAGLSTAAAARLDADGATVWEREFALAGYVESEGGAAAWVPGGVLVYVQEYVSPAWGGVPRVVRLDDAGAPVWDWIGRGRGDVDTPLADVLRLTERGTVAIDGHVVPKRGARAQPWRGELDATGVLVVDESGPARP